MVKKGKKILSLLLAVLMLVGLAVPSGVLAPSVRAAEEPANAWQVVSGKYEGNGAANKTTSGDVRIQKNVIPTDVENEFQVYMAIDAKCMEITTSSSMTELLGDETMLNSLYTGGSANGFPDAISGQEHEGNGSLANELKGSAKPCTPGDTRFKLVITYEKDGYTFLIAEPILSLGVPNSVLYLRVGEQYICLENINGKNMGTFEQDADGNYIVPVHLTSMAYNALMTTHSSSSTTTTTSLNLGENGSATILDPIGDNDNSYIVYDGFVSGDVENPPVALTSPGGTVTWTLKPKAVPAKPTPPSDAEKTTSTDGPTTSTSGDIQTTTTTSTTTYTWTENGRVVTYYESMSKVETLNTVNGTHSEETQISSSWWAENIVEITYNVHLAVDKAGFASGNVYPVNGTTTLTYGDNQTANFPVPTVKGTLYDFSFTKTDDSGTALPNVSFTVTGPSDNPDVASTTKTATSGTNGAVSVTGLPWGTYTLTETVPAGYTGSSIDPLTIGYTSWPDKVTHNDTANDVYTFPNGGKVVNTLNTVTVNKAVAVFGDLTLAEVDHTIYIALLDKNSGEYLKKDGSLYYQTITIAAGVPSPASVTFEGVPSGEYDVMELASVDPIEVLGTNSQIGDGTKIKIYSIAGGNNADLINGVSSATVSFTNTYAHADVPVKFTANKKWATYSGTDMTAPEGATVTFTLYRTVKDSTAAPEEVASVTLDGTTDALVEDANGIKTGELTAWEATFDNLPNQNTEDIAYIYMVKETPVEGYAAYLGNNAMGENDYLTQNGGSITNRKQSTDVTVQKEVSGHNPDNQAFSFTAVYGATSVTFELKDGDTKVLTDVPVGANLTVTETEVANFKAEYAIGGGAKTEGSECTYTVAEPADTITFTNTREVGDLTVSKAVVSDLPTDKSLEFSFTVKLDDTAVSGTFGGAAFTGGEATFTLKDGDSVTITGLPAGVGYTVTEAAADGFTTEKTGDKGTISTTASAAAFTNTRKTGDLTISKTVKSPINADEEKEFSFVVFLQGALATLNKDYDLVVKAADGTESTATASFKNGSLTITLKNGESATIKGLPESAGFQVHEGEDTDFIQSPLDADGYPIISGTISSTAAFDAAFTNTRDMGQLTIEKTVVGLDGSTDEVPAAAQFTISGEPADGSKFDPVAITYADITAGNNTIDVPFGTYTVKETGAEIDGYTLETDYSADVTLTKDSKTGTITVTNEYIVDKAQLTITKEVTGLQGDVAELLKGVTFTITCDKPVAGITVDPATLTYADILAGKNTIEVPLGTYSVTETGAEVTGYGLTATYSDPAVVAKDSKAELKVTNKYEEGMGTLTLTKVATGLEGTDKVPADAKFTVKGTPTAAGVTFEPQTFTYEEIQSGKSLSVPLGTYSVEETGAEVTGYTLTTTYSASAKIEKAGDKAELTVTNTYTLDKATLTIEKIAEGLVGEDTVPEDAAFTITGKPTAAGAEFKDVVITYADIQSGKNQIEVPVGTYSVTETGAELEGYGLTTTYSASEATLTKESNTATLTVTNTYVDNSTSLTVTKRWEDENDKDGLRPESITVKLIRNGEECETAELSAANNWQCQWTLPAQQNGVDLVYTVDEDVEIAGYEKSISGSVESGSVIITNTHVVETPPPPITTLKIRIIKRWDDNNNAAGKRTDSVTVSLLMNDQVAYVEQLSNYNGWQCEWMAIGGVNYSVIEDPVSGYETSIERSYFDNVITFTVTNKLVEETPVLNTSDHVAYIVGYPDGTVRPDREITRAEVATIFFRLLTEEARDKYWSQTNPYPDVQIDDWFNNAISTLTNMGIINGYPDGTFRPNEFITRAELTKIAVCFFTTADEYFGKQSSFTDVPVDAWYGRFIAAAEELGLINGYPDGTFRPNNYITRAETCTIVNRTLGRVPHKDHLLSYMQMINWPDNADTNAWYYAQIQEATNSHDYVWTVEDIQTTVEQWTAKLPERNWVALEQIWSNSHSAPGGEVMGYDPIPEN